MHGFTRNLLPNVGLGLLAQSQGDLILELIWIDLRCHLEVTVAQQGHFGIKSTVAKKQ